MQFTNVCMQCCLIGFTLQLNFLQESNLRVIWAPFSQKLLQQLINKWHYRCRCSPVSIVTTLRAPADTADIYFKRSNLFYQQKLSFTEILPTLTVCSDRTVCAPLTYSFLQNFCTFITQVVWVSPLGPFPCGLPYQANLQ